MIFTKNPYDRSAVKMYYRAAFRKDVFSSLTPHEKTSLICFCASSVRRDSAVVFYDGNNEIGEILPQANVCTVKINKKPLAAVADDYSIKLYDFLLKALLVRHVSADEPQQTVEEERREEKKENDEKKENIEQLVALHLRLLENIFATDYSRFVSYDRMIFLRETGYAAESVIRAERVSVDEELSETRSEEIGLSLGVPKPETNGITFSRGRGL